MLMFRSVLMWSLATTAVCAAADFEQDVLPIFRRHCLRCHGTQNQAGDLQLNLRSSVLGHGPAADPVVVPGQSAASRLLERVTDEDAGDLMPLDGSPLSAGEVEILTQWVAQGARWPDELAEPRHWAWEPVERPLLPQPESGINPVDQFVRQRLARETLTPSVPLDRSRLLRRLSLALTGLPPTVDDVRSFVADDSPDAVVQAVDQLLASPRFGERWAVPWMDVARYADSNGFQADQLRDNWAWRDWVIRALNDDMPFDQFVVEQLAGDLLPNATVDQRVATGFHRMTTCNVEAGVHPEANRVNQIVDRVNTTGTAFLGVTIECAQCHDHKYDPFTQEDYYRLFAFFNNTPLEVKNTRGVTWDFYGPTMDLPLRADLQQRRDQLLQRQQQIEEQKQKIFASEREELQAWIAQVAAHRQQDDWTVVTPRKVSCSDGSEARVRDDASVLISSRSRGPVTYTLEFAVPEHPVSALRLQALPHDALPQKGPGRKGKADTLFSLREIRCELLQGDQVTELPLEVAWADRELGEFPAASVLDQDESTAWSPGGKTGQPVSLWVTLAEPLTSGHSEDRLRVTLVQSEDSIGRPRISLTSQPGKLLELSDNVQKPAAGSKRTDEQNAALRQEYAIRHPQLSRLVGQLSRVQTRLEEIQPESTLVMVEMDQPRETFVLTRGDYEQPAEQVTAGPPRFLPQDAQVPATGNRLELARWLTSPKNPLLARVTVNRWWATLFGRGLVTTPEDFGTQAAAPSHPQLLDWLAAEFVDSGWSMKHILRLIVLSETWQQSAVTTPEQWQQDPDNRLLARGPRFRLPAELIRDNALAISGLLSEQMYGPPVMPWQPEGVWRSIGRNQPTWQDATDTDRYRRGVYVIWKRAAPYPGFVAFDAPDRGACTVQRSRSNTPLQALTLLNDRGFAEMALALADRVLSDPQSKSDADRLEAMLLLAIARPPADSETQVLQGLLLQERDRLQAEPKLVDQRMKLSPPAWTAASDDPTELAVWFAVANAVLNLDETMTP